MTTIFHKMDGLRRHPVLGQLVRFGVAGGIATLIYSAVYLSLALLVFPREQAVLAVPIAFAAAVSVGYFLHSGWSFKGHGSRQKGPGQQAKFVLVQGVGLGLHAAITWVVTDIWGQPAWAPLIPGLLIVPLLTFVLNRQWVFK